MNKADLVYHLQADAYARGNKDYNSNLINQLDTNVDVAHIEKEYKNKIRQTKQKSDEYFSNVLGTNYTVKYSKDKE